MAGSAQKKVWGRGDVKLTLSNLEKEKWVGDGGGWGGEREKRTASRKEKKGPKTPVFKP